MSPVFLKLVSSNSKSEDKSISSTFKVVDTAISGLIE